MKRFFTGVLIVVLLFSGFSLISAADTANAPKCRMVKEFDSMKDPESVIVPGRKWLPYPDYSDRQAWDELAAPFKESLIKLGNRYLKYQWQLQRASAYLEYEKTGNRKLMIPEEDNRKALVNLLVAELVEGKGRYMNQIVDGVYFLCQQYSWAHGQHTTMQKSKRTLPTYDDAVVSLHGAATGSTLAMAHYFLREEFDKLDPSISAAIRREVKRQIITPYEDDSMDDQHWWKGFSLGNHVLNNWNPFCNYNALLCTLLLEEDQERLIKTFRRCCESTDKYLDYVKQDGACDEGPTYWVMSCGTLYDLLKIMSYSTDGRFDIFDDEMIRKMGEFKATTWFDGGWVMNFGDGGSREMGNVPLLFRYGKDVRSQSLMDFSLSLMIDEKKQCFTAPRAIPGSLTGLLLGSLETMKLYPEMKARIDKVSKENGGDFRKTLKSLRAGVKSECYPLTEYGIFRKGDWSLAAKGGHNMESHNHNDVGSAMLFVDGFPVLIDPGVGEYTKDTFSANRYSIWNMGSSWHNLPVINGEVQSAGREYCATGTKIDLAKGVFTTDISKAYPENAACRSWQRTYSLKDGSLTISDQWNLSERKAADELHLIVRGTVEKVKPGELHLSVWDAQKKRSAVFVISYPSSMACEIETKEYKDARLVQSWFVFSLSRIILKGKDNAPLSGKSVVTVRRLG